MTGPSTTSSASLIFSIVPHAALVLSPLLRQDEASFFVLLLEDEGLDLVTELDDLVGIDVVADRQLARGDDAFRLVPDVQQDLVLVDFDHRALHDLAVFDIDHRSVDGVGKGGTQIVGDDLARRVVPGVVEGTHTVRLDAGAGGGVGQDVDSFVEGLGVQRTGQTMRGASGADEPISLATAPTG